MSKLIQNFRYRPEIDGLRAIAVLAVVFFHAGIGMPGGFIGVDVFFVISGFLITSLIIKDLQSGTFSLANFWERRARRIFPAAAAMVFVVLVAGWFFLLPSDYANLGKSAAWQAVFAANFHFWKTTNYFSGPADEQPLLHTWSLAVEEQFYLFVPLILLAVFRFPSLRSRPILIAIFSVGFVASLAISILTVTRTPAAAFYLLPTRAWELLAGSIVAVVPSIALATPRWIREFLCWAGLAAIITPCLLYSKETPFPGIAALPPCLGTAIIIWASSRETSETRNCACRLLAWSPIVFIGLISYSLYLWHWPLFAFGQYLSITPLSSQFSMALVVASFIFAIISWRLVESPYRKRQLGSSRKAMFTWAFSSITATFLIATLIVKSRGIPNRFGTLGEAISQANVETSHSHRKYPETTMEDARLGRFIQLGNAANEEPLSLLVWGDSHAGALIPAFEAIADELNTKIAVAWHAGTAPVLGYSHPNRYSFGDKTPEFNQLVFDYIRSSQVQSVLLVCRWHGHTNDDTTRTTNQPDFLNCLLATIAELRAIDLEVFILKSIPEHGDSVPRLIFLSEVFGHEISNELASQNKVIKQWQDIRSVEIQSSDPGVHFIDLSHTLIDKESGLCRLYDNGGIFFSDAVHLSPHGARTVRNLFLPSIDRHQ